MTARRRVVVLGMMAKAPVPGVIWQTVHYLLGLERLGFDAYYVEAHARTPAMLMRSESDDGAELAAGLIADVMRRFDLADRWAYHALHGDGRCYGMSEPGLRRLYREAELLINLHGGTRPQPEQAERGRLVYLETDPVQLQIDLHDGVESAYDFLEPHAAFFTFAENLGGAGCDLPVSERFAFQPTRQPVLLDLWAGRGAPEPALFTTVGNWRQPWRAVEYQGERYSWTKDEQWRGFLDLPRRTSQRFELALSGTQAHHVAELRRRGWQVRDALAFGTDTTAYRDYIAGSRAELTVAKEQNVRFRTGWFSDRSATYLAAGRPVVTQDTGFGDVLPAGEGLFAVSTVEDAAAAVEAINGDYARHRRAASDIAREHFRAERVLGDLLSQCGATTRRSKMTQQDVGPAASTTHSRHRLGPRSSVLAIVPHFRCEEWLDDCLESLVRQTRPLDGIVVIDDASDEPPTRLVQRYPEVTLLHADRKGGPYRLVQQIIEETDYDAYMFQDADDWSAPDRLELLLRYAEEAGAELIGTQEIRVFCDEPEVTPIKWPLDVNAQFAEKPTAFPLLHPTSLVTRDLVMGLGGFASGLPFSGDAEFLRRARFVTDVINIPHHCYYRRVRQGSLTTAPETGLQSPERQRVMEMLWARARHNAELVADGGEPDLEPIAVAPPVGLAHLAGPALSGRRPAKAARRPPVAAPPKPPVGGPPRPIFVVGADRSGVSALAWALGEHPGIASVPDGAWLGDLVQALAGVHEAAVTSDGPGLGQRPPSAAAFAARFGGAAGAWVAGGASRWVDGSWQHTFAIERLAELFPAAKFVHVVRDRDSTVDVLVDPPLGAAGATGGTQVPARLRAKLKEPEAVERWTSANAACVDAQEALGETRMLQVSFDALVDAPETVLRECLEFVGEPYGPECMRPLRQLRARKVEAARAPGADAPVDEQAERDRILAMSRQTTRDVLSECLPPASVVAVVSRGDDELVRVDGHRGLHFPQTDDGRWVGHHPVDGVVAVRHLQEVVGRGARFLFIPCTSLWWLDHYPELRRELQERHRGVFHDPEQGALFELLAEEPAVKGTAAAAKAAIAAPPAGKRIVLVTDHFPKFSETFFAREFAELRARGWDVHVLCNRSNKDQWPYFPELGEELASRERIHIVRDFEAQLTELAPDIVHFGYGTLAQGRMHIRELLGCKVVVSFRGYDINYAGLDEPGYYDDVWASADMLHLVSDDVWKRAQRRGCPADTPHVVITDAADVTAFTAPDRRYEDVGTPARPLHIVSVGRLVWKKGYEYALSAVRWLRDRGVEVRYRIVGEGPHREPIMFAIHDLGLEEDVELLGAADATQVQETMRWADVCLHASVSEGFCVSVIEAQAMGLPVVCSDADGLAQNIEHEVTGFVVARRNAGALAERLLALAGDRAMRERLGTAARRRAERHFDIPRQLDEMESLYRSVLAAPVDEARRLDRRKTLSELERQQSALDSRREALAKEIRARRVVERVHEDVERLLPGGARVLVIARGDDELVELANRDGWHFPRAESGKYAGHHPADSAEAIAHLEALRRRGADYLVIPATSSWWLEHYDDFRRHLDERYVEVATDPDSCVIYDLGAARAAPAVTPSDTDPVALAA